MVGGSNFDRLRQALVEGTFYQNSFQFIIICKEEEMIAWADGIMELNGALPLMNILYQMVCDLRSDLLPKFLSARCAVLLPFIANSF